PIYTLSLHDALPIYAQLEEGNHEHSNEEFRSIGSTSHALTWAQTHPCASRKDSSGHPDRGALSCQAPGILYSSSDRLHRRCVWLDRKSTRLNSSHSQ